MAKQLNEFLQTYFKIFRMADMRDNHTEQWAHLLDAEKSGDMTKDQKGWVKDLLERPNPNDPLDVKALPAESDLSDADWENLFRICQNTYFLMNSDRYSYAGNDKVIDFLNEWQHLFTDTNQASQIAAPETKRQCQQLGKLLKNHKEFIRNLLEQDDNFSGILNSETKDIQSLIDGLENGKFDTDEKFQQKVRNLASIINRIYESKNHPLRDKFTRELGSTKPEIFLIYDSTGWIQPNINAAHLNDFKTQYHSLFRTLYKDNKVLDAFKAHESGDNRISNAIENAKNGIDYDKTDSKNFLTPKRDDALTPMQQVQKWARETYEDCLEKYTTLSGDRLFFSDQAKKIAKALDKAGIKPTDGIAGLCSGDKISKAAAALKSSPTANEQFDWMTKTLKSFVDDPNMKKTVAGALKNGRQMHNLISELIIKAVEDNKVNEAKTAMEVLSVMKYGSVTSRIMDAFKGQDFTLFSDGGLSWNKNEGVKFVTKALDKSIKLAFRGAGYAVTFFGNEFRLLGSKYNGQFQHGDKDKAGKKLKQLSTAHDNRTTVERATFDTNKTAADAIDTANRNQHIARRKSALGYLRINETDPDASQKVTEKERDTNTKLKSQQANHLARLQPLQEELRIYEEAFDLLRHKEQYEAELNALNMQLGAATTAAEKRAINAQIDLVAEDIRKNNVEIANYKDPYYTTSYPFLVGIESKSSATVRDYIDNVFTAKNSVYDKVNTKYQAVSDKIARREHAIQQFRDAESEISNLTKALEKRQKEYDNWDKDHKNAYQELAAYWDMLETGRDSHTGKMYGKLAGFAIGSKKAKQKAFDAQKQAIIDSYWQVGQTYAA